MPGVSGGLQELQRSLALDVVRGDQTHDTLLTHDQHRANAQMNHVLQRVVDLAFFVDADWMLAREIGDRMDRRVARIQELAVGDRAAGECSFPEFWFCYQPSPFP